MSTTYYLVLQKGTVDECLQLFLVALLHLNPLDKIAGAFYNNFFFSLDHKIPRNINLVRLQFAKLSACLQKAALSGKILNFFKVFKVYPSLCLNNQLLEYMRQKQSMWLQTLFLDKNQKLKSLI